MLHLCSACLGKTDYICQGHDSDGKIFDLYSCPDCKAHIREYPTPKPVALVTLALSDKPKQLRMFPKSRATD